MLRAALLATLVAAPAAAAQTPPATAPVASPPPTLSGPAVRATGVSIPLRGAGLPPGAIIELQRQTPAGWVTIKTAPADAHGALTLRYRPSRISPRYGLRLAVAGLASAPIVVRSRDVMLAAFGDVNLGDGVLSVMDRRGALHPWRGVGPTLRRADIAFGNLECAISTRGVPVEKEYTFRGRPRDLAAVVRFAGLDVLNLANNHAGDYGMPALLDTVRSVHDAGALPVGAGATLASAREARVVTRLGLRVAFVGFSDIGPASFFAAANSPGTSSATFPAVTEAVRAARRRADIVVATFHWGVERATGENDRQRSFAQAALAAGAIAVIGAHPHVLHRPAPARPSADRLQPRQLRLVGRLGGDRADRDPPAWPEHPRRGDLHAATGDHRGDAPAAAGLTVPDAVHRHLIGPPYPPGDVREEDQHAQKPQAHPDRRRRARRGGSRRSRRGPGR